MRLTACHAIADWIPENGAGYESRTRPGGSVGATSVYQRGRITGRIVKGRRSPNVTVMGTRATPAAAAAATTPRQSGSTRWMRSRTIASMTAAARNPMAMKRCSITFSMMGSLVKIQAGSHWPCRSPNEHTTQRKSTKPKNHRRRSRRKATTPARRTATKPQPRYPADASGAPSYPPSVMNTLWGSG